MLATATPAMAGDLVMERCVTPAGHDGPQVVAVTRQGVRHLFVQRTDETVEQLLERARRV
jgi:hypothetical protein